MFRNRFILLALVATLGRTFADISTSPKVTLPHGGILIGSLMSSVNGKEIHAYRGIPYAEPPVGKLRFQAPVPAQSWSGEKLSNKDAEVCPQQNSLLRIFTTIGNEDCLYLNVYTPKERTQLQPLSVMFFIHSGAFMLGGGISKIYGPDRILDIGNIILVTGNYRLGPLGFLSTGTRDCPGNNGLKDQVLILKWIRDNIAAFGGNPDDVTLAGESAGSGCVAHHVYSPLTEGLFHKAILQSGTNFNWWALDERRTASAYAAKLGKLLNCSVTEENWNEMIECLRTKTTDEIISTIQDFFEFDIDPIILFKPAVEPDIPGSFVTKIPDITVEPRNNIPIMIGLTADEGVIRAGPLINLKNDEFKENFNEVLPKLLFYNHKPEDIQKKITAKVDEFYFNKTHNWSKTNHQNLTNLFSDAWFYRGTDQFLRQRFNSKNSSSVRQTYVYLFDHKGSMFQTQTWFKNELEYDGVCHGDELLYLFPLNLDTTVKSADKNDETMKWAMPLMWTNFVKTGNPTPPGSNITAWKPAKGFPLNYAHLGTKNREDWTILRNEIGLAEARIQFWRDLEEVISVK